MTVTIDDDFDLKKIADSGQCFRVRQKSDGSYVFITGRHMLNIRAVSENTYMVSCTEEEWRQVWHRYFDLDRSYRGIRAGISAEDLFLAAAAEEAAGVRILRQDVFEMLITFIISQRKSIPAIKVCVEAICTIYGRKGTAGQESVYFFPTPDELAKATEEELRGCKTGYRAPYIMDAADAAASGRLDLNSLSSLTDEKLLETLKSVRGIGDKVANCIALFACGRTSMAPVDTWIRQIIDTKYNGISPFPCYGENAGILQQYMFYYAIHHKKAVHEHW